MIWRLLESSDKDIYTNLAIEEAIARVNASNDKKTNTLRFWRSSSAVVMGRFQCVHKEVNMQFCQENGIPIARRFTGGGTVYHDQGNLNFTICADQKEVYVKRTLPELYEVFIGGIAERLQERGIPAIFDPYRSCLRINGKKITGTAGWVKQGVSFIHGTMLIDSNLEILHESLSIPNGQTPYSREGKIRCMESKRDVVTNISNEIESRPSDTEIEVAIAGSIESISGTYVCPGKLTDEELKVAQSLYQTRYSQTKWNMGTPVPEKSSS
jgi:lipoate-protein ligase A